MVARDDYGVARPAVEEYVDRAHAATGDALAPERWKTVVHRHDPCSLEKVDHLVECVEWYRVLFADDRDQQSSHRRPDQGSAVHWAAELYGRGVTGAFV